MRFVLARHLGRETLRLGRDRFSRRCPIPRSIGEVDASTLSRLLGRRVTGTEVLCRTEGTTDRARLALEGAEVPDTVFVKVGASAPVVRLFANLADLGICEVGFYRDVRPGLAIEAPAVHAVDQDPATKRFVLVLEDLEVRGAAFGDLLTPLRPEQAGTILDTLAVLHGTFWCSPRLVSGSPGGGLGWVRAGGSDPLLPVFTRAVTSVARRSARRDRSPVPAAGRAIVRAYPAVARELDEGPHTLLHGDPHPGNCYFVDGRGGLLDWQVLRRGNALRDVAYCVVLSLDLETRRSAEKELLDRYREALAAAGGPDMSAGETWNTYRKMAAYPYVAAMFTTGLAGLQDAAVAAEGLRRAAAAIDDLETAKTLDALA